MHSLPDRHPKLSARNANPRERETAEILLLRGEAREKRLLDSDHLEQLVSSLPPEEFFFTLKEASLENLPTLLACARPVQLQFLLDLELWRKDRLLVERVGPWLERLAEAPSRALGRWLAELDLSVWTLLIGTVVQVRAQDEDSDPFQDELGPAPFTLDGVHYFFGPPESGPALRNLLARLRDGDADRYHRLVEALSRDVDSELEDLCHEERSRRLAERGFPTWEEAYEVYARLSPARLDELPLRTVQEAVEGEIEPFLAPRYPLEGAEAASEALRRAVGQLGADVTAEAFWAELAYLTNKVLVADGLALDDVDSFHRALDKVAGYVSIGVESLCGADGGKTRTALADHWLQHLFRVGWTRIRTLQTEARRFLDKGWPAGRLERLLFLDTPLPETLDGLLRRHPLLHVGDAGKAPLREFRSLAEVLGAERTVRKADLLGRYLLSVTSFQLKDLRDAASHLDLDNLKGSTVFLTALLNSALDRSFRFSPVDRTTARTGLARLWEEDRPPRRVKPGLADAAVEWSRAVAPTTVEEEEFLREFVGDSFRLLEEEFGHLAADETPDPRFTKGLWIE